MARIPKEMTANTKAAENSQMKHTPDRGLLSPKTPSTIKVRTWSPVGGRLMLWIHLEPLRKQMQAVTQWDRMPPAASGVKVRVVSCRVLLADVGNTKRIPEPCTKCADMAPLICIGRRCLNLYTNVYIYLEAAGTNRNTLRSGSFRKACGHMVGAQAGLCLQGCNKSSAKGPK